MFSQPRDCENTIIFLRALGYGPNHLQPTSTSWPRRWSTCQRRARLTLSTAASMHDHTFTTTTIHTTVPHHHSREDAPPPFHTADHHCHPMTAATRRWTTTRTSSTPSSVRWQATDASLSRRCDRWCAPHRFTPRHHVGCYFYWLLLAPTQSS